MTHKITYWVEHPNGREFLGAVRLWPWASRGDVKMALLKQLREHPGITTTGRYTPAEMRSLIHQGKVRRIRR